METVKVCKAAKDRVDMKRAIVDQSVHAAYNGAEVTQIKL